MDLELCDDQLALRHAARDLLDEQAAPERVRVVAAAEPGHRIERDLWRAMVDQGWLAIGLPGDDAGLGLGTAAWCIAAGHDDAPVAAPTAKTWCADAAERVMASGLQVHGGIGFTWEHDLHLLRERSQLDQVSYGDATFHRDRLAGLLRARVRAGESVV